jgi:iron complex outermembrane receptor protein
MLSGLAAALATGTAWATSEAEFFGEMPVVLSVTRLAQPLDETPGAVTVIDRDMIRRSGARELAELLRLVPGFVVSHFEGGARPFVNYHSDYDAYNRRIQVYIDGRSVYSGLVIGSALYGMMGVVLEDIERIEVLRGSNSAAYGANAFLGVINIVTRHAEDTRGGLVSVNAGGQGVRDATARFGWGGDGNSYRLTAATRQDHGFDGTHDDKRVDQAHFRADLSPGATDDISFSAGLVRFRWGAPITDFFPPRSESWQNGYAQLQWQRALDQNDKVQASLLIDREEFSDFYPLARADGVTSRLNLNAQHTFSPGLNWRVVWGGEFRREAIRSHDLFNTDDDQVSQLWRLFGNVEWHPGKDWVVNAGGLWEDHNQTDAHFAPRLMVNYHLTPDHSVRVGSSRAYKVPSQLETQGDWWYGPFHLMEADSRVRSERIDAHEIGYLGQFRSAKLTVDLRLFRERVASVIGTERSIPNNNASPLHFLNKDPSVQQGWEAQLRWRPLAGTEVLVNHAVVDLRPDAESTVPQDAHRSPGHVSTLALFQRLPYDFDLNLTYYRVGRMFWVRQSNAVPAFDQLDLRLAKSFRLDGHRAEAAIVVQAADGEHYEFQYSSTPSISAATFTLDRRVFATFRLEF